MKIICVDDEELILNLIIYMCEQIPQIDEVEGFSSALKALDYIKNNKADIALLDIDMPEMNGITLAVKIKVIDPEIKIIFLTGYSQYAVDAFKIHAQGYLMKPINKDRLIEEINFAAKENDTDDYPHFFARTFGAFDFLIDGQPIKFSRSKSKELLAYLIDKKGAGITRADAFSALYEDAIYDRKMQKQFDVIIRSLKETLSLNDAEEILDIKSGELRIKTDLIKCDLYSLLDGDIKYINSYQGEYMSAYPWASMTEAFIDNKLNK